MTETPATDRGRVNTQPAPQTEMEHARRTSMDDLSLAANFPTGRRDHSRSPPTQAFHDESRGRDSRHRDDDTRHDKDYDRRHGRFDEGYPRRAGASRGPRYNARDDYDYGGMYDDGHAADGDRHRSEKGRYRDDDDPRSRSPSGSYHNRSRSHSPTREAGKPTDTVILEGLPFSISSNELRDSILNNTIAAEFPSIDVRVSASKGHRRAFVQFQEVDHAIAFMREHYPKLPVELTHSTDDVPEGRFDAYIHYARSRDTRDEPDARGGASGNNWICPTCDFSNYSTRIKCKICGGPQTAWQHSLTGMADAADVPSQILVVYPLASFVNEDMLVNDMKCLELVKPDNTKDNSNGAPKLKSTAPTGDTTGYGARPGSLHRVFLMRDVNTNESFKYGFAEFWTVEDAAAAMTKFHKSRSFAVAACPVTVSSTHMGVFVPEEREVTPATEHLSFNPLFNPNLRVRYRDPHVYPSQLVLTTHPPEGEEATKAPADEGNDKKTKKRKADGNLPASSAKKSVPMAGQMAMWQRKRNELRDNHNDEPEKPELSDVNRTPLRISLPGNGADGAKAQNTIKISIAGTTKLGPSESVAPGKPAASEGVDTPDNVAQPATTSEEAPVSYVDRDRLMCLICMRKYKSVDEVNIHEKSRNHKNAMENEEQVNAALPRLAARDKRLQKQAQEKGDAQATGSQYRDRAKERREAYNQPVKPTTAPAQPSKPKPVSKPEEAAQPAKPAQSKGAGMLAKMGWSSGAGLGANADGRTEVIVTNAYQEGVGLGAEGGNLGDAAQLAERKTKNSYADYVNTVQDKARERYNKMG
ncbi:RNA binding motif [Fusarium albosuccineum]|uniref:RNA binding motif n=1 Tax=Fusarium albosuccineum TaxID=1237068 RepID=A0A8H4LNB1_9HYPO|nr:RNA binding motif [Fusarium albosuccineum]